MTSPEEHPRMIRKNVLKLASAGLLAGIALSIPLWLSNRAYPLTPLPFFDLLPAWISDILLAALAVLLLLHWKNIKRTAETFVQNPVSERASERVRIQTKGSAVQNRSVLLILLFFTLILLFAFDQSRLQPWAVLYGLIFFIYGFDKNEARATETVRLLFVFLYLWSGIQKLNAAFLFETFPWFIEPLTSHLPNGVRNFLNGRALLAPLLEIGIGILLLTPWRRTGVVLATAMHVGVLLLIGPLGRNWNSVVWPWNLLMPLFLYTLFWHEGFRAPKRLIEKNGVRIAVLIFAGILPALSLFGLWDSYLSFALYSGNIRDAEIRLADGTVINVFSWSMEAVNAPAYPEPRIYRSALAWMCERHEDAELTIYERPHWLTDKREIVKIDCADN